MVQDSIGLDKYKLLLKSAKVAVKVNTVYNNVTNPLTLVQITQEHFPHLMVCSMLSHSIIVSFITNNKIDLDYDNFSYFKDVSEGYYTVVSNIVNIEQTDYRRMFLVYVRMCLLIYRVLGHYLHIDHSNIGMCVIDYLHFLTSCKLS